MIMMLVLNFEMLPMCLRDGSRCTPQDNGDVMGPLSFLGTLPCQEASFGEPYAGTNVLGFEWQESYVSRGNSD